MTITKRMLILATLCFALGACDSNKTPEATEPKATDAVEPGEKPEAQGSEDDHEGEVHLGEHMYEIGKRFAALWYAGKAGNVDMVDYQLHEMHEVIEEIESKDVEENGVDVGSRLESDVEAHFGPLKKAVEDQDSERFEELYTQMTARCTTCHIETDHGFLKVKKPDYNPYPNLEF